ncbi:MAG: ECF transporter S component [Oscillospiraceae bacterium]|nr:ECF transporter S component [Oscillospiraceae bacterium]
MKNKKVLFMVQLAVFTAIEAIFCFTPLGSLPIGPGIVATLAHIPALIVAMTLGKMAALYMGTIMGVFSLIIWTFMPPNPLYAFCFSPFMPNGNIWSLVICIVPRMVFPVVAAVLFELLIKIFSKNKSVSKPKTIAFGAIVAAVSSLIHSVLVLGTIFLVFGGNADISQSIIEQAGTGADVGISSDLVTFLVAWGWLNSICEAIVAAIVCGAIVVPIRKVAKQTN